MNNRLVAAFGGLLQLGLLQVVLMEPSAPIRAAAFEQATIKRLVDGREVYIGLPEDLQTACSAVDLGTSMAV